MPYGYADELEVVTTVLRKVCQRPTLEITPEMRLDELPGMDSLRVLHVVTMIEERVGVEIDVAALDRLVRIRDIVSCIQAAIEAATPQGRVAG